LVVQVAVRLLPAPVTTAAAHPVIELAPSMKFTLPVGLLPLTVAVNVTDLPTVDGLSELPTVVVVVTGPPAALTTCETALLVDVRFPASPP
jgi:hypothetical protein